MGFHAVQAQHRGHAQSDVADAVFAVHHGGHRQNGPLIADDAGTDAPHRHSDAVVGGLLFGDDIVGAVFYGLRNLVQLHFRVVVAPHLAEGVQRNAGNVGAA